MANPKPFKPQPTRLADAIVRVLSRPAGFAAFALGAPAVFAAPQGGQVVDGAATISTPDAFSTRIDQSSTRAILQWQQFSIAGNEYVQFVQPGSHAVALNRVVGGVPSEILGNLSANGQVFLVNPQGIFFGQGASVDVQALVATTMDISNQNFMAGDYVFARGPDAPAHASVINEGAITAAQGGYVVLAGDYAENSGVIQAQLGAVVLAAGAEMTLDVSGDGLVNFAVDAATVSELAGVKNAGQLFADGGRVILTADVAQNLLGAAVNNEGLIQAHSVVEQDGAIYLAAVGGDVQNSGTIDASATAGNGGVVEISAEGGNVLLTAGSIFAEGVDGEAGGTIDIAATAPQGRLDQAGAIVVEGGVEVSADAGSGGDGGTVTVTADGDITLKAHSVITADGGGEDENGNAGDGGEVRVVARRDLDFQELAEITAAAGDSAAEGGFIEVSGHGGLALGGHLFTRGGQILYDPATINWNSSSIVNFINTPLGLGTDVAVIATDSITFSAAGIISAGAFTADLLIGIGTGPSIAGFVPGSGNGNGTINFNGVDVNIQGDLSVFAGTATGDIENVDFISANNVTLEALGGRVVSDSAGDIDINATGDVVVRAQSIEVIDSFDASLAISAGGSIDIEGNIDVSASFGRADVTLLGSGVTVRGDIDLAASTGASLSIDAGSGALLVEATSTGVTVDGGEGDASIRFLGNGITVNADVTARVFNSSVSFFGSSDPDADIYFDAGSSGTLQVNGSVLASVDVTGFPSFGAPIDGAATITYRAGSIVQASDVAAMVSVRGSAGYGGGAFNGDAVVDIEAEGGSVTVSDGVIRASAFASHFGTAGGSADTVATADGLVKVSATSGSVNFSNADIAVSAAAVNEQNVSSPFGGTPTALATAEAQVNTFGIGGGAIDFIGGVSHNGDILATADARALGTPSGAVAPRSTAGAWVNVVGEDSISINGDVLAVADAHLPHSFGTGFGPAGAQVHIQSLTGGVSLNGGVAAKFGLGTGSVDVAEKAIAEVRLMTGHVIGGATPSYVGGGDITLNPGASVLASAQALGRAEAVVDLWAVEDSGFQTGGSIVVNGAGLTARATELAGSGFSFFSPDAEAEVIIEALDGSITLNAPVLASASGVDALAGDDVGAFVEIAAGITTGVAGDASVEILITDTVEARTNEAGGTGEFIGFSAGGDVQTAGGGLLEAGLVAFNPSYTGVSSSGPGGNLNAVFDVATKAGVLGFGNNVTSVTVNNSAHSGVTLAGFGASYSTGFGVNFDDGAGAGSFDITTAGDLDFLTDVNVGGLTLNVGGDVGKSGLLGAPTHILAIQTVNDLTVNSGTLSISGSSFASIGIVAGGAVTLQDVNVNTSSSGFGSATAKFDVIGGADVTLNGAVTVAEVNPFGAHAVVDVRADGVLTINAIVLAQATASTGTASAEMFLTGLGGMNLNGDVTAQATGLSTGSEITLAAGGTVSGPGLVTADRLNLNLSSEGGPAGSAGALFGSSGAPLSVNVSDINMGPLGAAFLDNAFAGVFQLDPANFIGQNLSLILAGGLNLGSTSPGLVDMNVAGLNLDVGGVITADAPKVQITSTGGIAIKAAGFNITGSVSSASLMMSAATDIVLDTPINVTDNGATPNVVVDIRSLQNLTVNQAILAQATGSSGGAVNIDLAGGSLGGAVHINNDVTGIARAQDAGSSAAFVVVVNVIGEGTGDIFLNTGTLLAKVADDGPATPAGGTAHVHAEAVGGNLTQAAAHIAEAEAVGRSNAANAWVELTADKTVSIAGDVMASALGRGAADALVHIHEHVGAAAGSVNITGANLSATAGDFGTPGPGSRMATLELISEQGGVSVDGATVLTNSAVTTTGSAYAYATIRGTGGAVNLAPNLAIDASAASFASALIDIDAGSDVTAGDLTATATESGSGSADARILVDTVAGSVALGNLTVSAAGGSADASISIGRFAPIGGTVTVGSLVSSGVASVRHGDAEIYIRADGGIAVAGSLTATGVGGVNDLADASASIDLVTVGAGAAVSVTGPITASATGAASDGDAEVDISATGAVTVGDITAIGSGQESGGASIDINGSTITAGNMTATAVGVTSEASASIYLSATTGNVTVGNLTASATGGSWADAAIDIYTTDSGAVAAGNMTATAVATSASGDASASIDVFANTGATLGALAVSATGGSSADGWIDIHVSSGAVTVASLSAVASGGTSDADVEIYVSASGDITVTNGVSAIARAGTESFASASASVDISAGGNVLIGGALLASADAATADWAWAAVFLSGQNVTTQSVTVNAIASETSGDVFAGFYGSADFGSGVFTTNGPLTVMARGGAASFDFAEASASVEGSVVNLLGAVDLDAVGNGAATYLSVYADTSATLTGPVTLDGSEQASAYFYGSGDFSLGTVTANGGDFSEIFGSMGGLTSGLLQADNIGFDGGEGGTGNGTLNVLTNTGDLFVANFGDATVDNTAFTGTLNLSLFGGFNNLSVTTGGDLPVVESAVAVSGNLLMGATGTLDLSFSSLTADIIDLIALNGDVLLSGSSLIGTSGVFINAGGSVLNGPALIDGGMVGVFAGGDIDLGLSDIFIGDNSDAARLNGDLVVTDFLKAKGVPVPNDNPNGLFAAGGTLTLGNLDIEGGYLWLEADDIALVGTVTSPNDIVVQFLPATPGLPITVTDLPRAVAGLNINAQEHFAPFTGTTFVVGGSFFTGLIEIPGPDAVNLDFANLLLATRGVTDVGGVASLEELFINPGLLFSLQLIDFAGLSDAICEIGGICDERENAAATASVLSTLDSADDLAEDKDEDDKSGDETAGGGEGEGGGVVEEGSASDEELQCS